jgi:hypothetical protein
MSEEKMTQDQEDYNTKKSYNQLVYGRYIFMAKVAGVLVLILFSLYMILSRIGKSLGETIVLPTIEEFLAKPEKLRAKDRLKVQRSLLKDVVAYRKDTVVIVVDDPKYLIFNERGDYKYPEERMIYGARLHALELVLKRGLLEMQYPFIFTHVILKDSLERFKESGYVEVSSRFPLYFRPSMKSSYEISMEESKYVVALRDSIVATFADLYSVGAADQLYKKFLGIGITGKYKYLTVDQFRKLSEEEQQEQRRAFFQLSEVEQNKIRNLELPVSSEFGCASWDEKPQAYFKTLVEQKMHELDLKLFLLPYYNQATYSLKYPMVRVVNLNFSTIGANKNSLLLIALKSGRAPAMYTLERKDCPRILKQGLFADITDQIKVWDQAKNFPVIPMSDATYMGRIYGVPSKHLQMDALMYRRDWLMKEPQLRNWCAKKGWMHPSDGEPYIPTKWTYKDFTELVKLITDTDPDKKRKGYVDRPGSMLYLEAHGLAQGLMTFIEYIKFSGDKTTWVFDKDNPLYLDGMKRVRDIVWCDRSVRTGVEVTYSGAHDDFYGNRAGISYATSSMVLTKSLNSKYSVFGNAKAFADIVGLTTMPCSEEAPFTMLPDCALVGFSPKLTQDQLAVAVDWIKLLQYGEFVNTALFFEVREAELLGSASLILRNALASVYDIDFKDFRVDFTGSFSKIMVDFYDSLRVSQRRSSSLIGVPKFEDFGLKTIPLRAIQDQIRLMFEKAMIDSLPNYAKILSSCDGYVNSAILNYKDDNDAQKYEEFLKATIEFFGRDTTLEISRNYRHKTIIRYEQFKKERKL